MCKLFVAQRRIILFVKIFHKFYYKKKSERMEGKKRVMKRIKNVSSKKNINEMDGRREVATIYVSVECQNKQ